MTLKNCLGNFPLFLRVKCLSHFSSIETLKFSNFQLSFLSNYTLYSFIMVLPKPNRLSHYLRSSLYINRIKKSTVMYMNKPYFNYKLIRVGSLSGSSIATGQ